MDIRLTTPITKEMLASLHIGDLVWITGTIYTGRDAAHLRLLEALRCGTDMPFPLAGSIIYYVGPTPTMPGDKIGSAGPTSSYRMDKSAPALMEQGLLAMIGKGPRSEAFKKALKACGGVYFSAIGGAAVRISQTIEDCRCIAYPELESEAIYQLKVNAFLAIVTYDTYGKDLFLEGKQQYQIRNESEAR